MNARVIMAEPRFYVRNVPYVREALQWWRSLSINEQNFYRKAYGTIFDWTVLRSEIVAIYLLLSEHICI